MTGPASPLLYIRDIRAMIHTRFHDSHFHWLATLRLFPYNSKVMPEQMITYAHSSGSPDAGRAHTTLDNALNNMPVVVKTERLTKRIHGVFALRNVSLTIRQGEIYGLVGVQGAGKSTLAQLLLGLMNPDSGTIRLFDSGSPAQARARIGYLPERPRYHGNFRGRDYLRFHADLSGLNGRDARLVVDRVADTVGLGDSARKLIHGYSKGLRQRLGLAVALLAGGAEPPELLVLDEPATGFDEETALSFRDIVLDARGHGSTVLICSRELTAVERTCTSIGILRAGRLLVQSQIDDSPRAHIIGVARDGAAEITSHLVEYLGRLHPSVLIRGGAQEGEHLHVVLPAGPGVTHAVAMKAAALRAMVDARWDIVSVYSENRDLESLFLQALPLSDSKLKALQSGTTETPASLGVVAATASVTGPLEDITQEEVGEENYVLQQKSPDTGPLATLDLASQPSASRSAETGPLGVYEPQSFSPADVSGNFASVPMSQPHSGSGGPLTAPLIHNTENALNGHEASLPPLPVRSVSTSRRTEVLSTMTSPKIGEGESNGDNGE